MTERTYTQEELNQAIKKALAETRKETAQKVADASEVPDYKAMADEVRKEIDEIRAKTAAIKAESERAIKRDSDRQHVFNYFYRKNVPDEVMPEMMAHLTDDLLDSLGSRGELDRKANALLNLYRNVIHEAQTKKKRGGGLFRKKKGAN